MTENHLGEKDIDILVSSPESLSREKRALFQMHIAECSICGEHYAIAMEFHSALEKNLSRESSSREKDLAQRLSHAGSELLLAIRGLQRSDSLPDTVAEITELKPSLTTRLIRFAAAHPGKAGASLIGVAALSLFLVTTFRGVEFRNPEYVKVQDGMMKVYDVEGNMLWTKRALGMPDGSTVSGFFDPLGRLLDGLILIDDINPAPGNEVLVRIATQEHLSKNDFSTDTLYCFDARGALIWTRSYAPADVQSFENERRGRWNVSGMFIVKSIEGVNRLFVFVYNAPFSPSALMEIDGTTGSPLQTYAHYGYMTRVAIAGSGQNAKIIAAGINNSFNQVFVAVLDPNALLGLGPTAENLDRGNSLRSTEIYYLLIPRSEMSERLSIYPYNGVSIPITTFEDGSFILTVDEFNPEKDSLTGGILYSFSEDLRLKSITFSDPLLRTYDLVSRRGTKLTPLDEEYAKSLAAKIRYWDGDRFVSVPTRNWRYADRMNLP